MTDTDAQSRFNTLNNRQKEVLTLVCEGLIYKEIGKRLFITVPTVKSHMGNIYRKLSLIDLPRNQRIARIFETYCPMLKEQPVSDQISEEEEEEPEPVPPEVERMLDEDEQEIILWRPSPIIDVTSKPVPRRKSKGSIWVFIGGIVVGIAILLGLLYIFRESIIGLITPDEPTPQEVAQKPSTTPTPAPSSTQEEQEVVVIVTATSPPLTKTPTPTNTSPPPTNTFAPTPYVPETFYGIGDWHEENQVAMRLMDYRTKNDTLYFAVEFWNKTDQTLHFSWIPENHVFLIDNLGRRHYTSVSQTENMEVTPGEKLIQRIPKLGILIINTLSQSMKYGIQARS